jgi:hypothetical protein
VVSQAASFQIIVEEPTTDPTDDSVRTVGPRRIRLLAWPRRRACPNGEAEVVLVVAVAAAAAVVEAAIGWQWEEREPWSGAARTRWSSCQKCADWKDRRGAVHHRRWQTRCAFAVLPRGCADFHPSFYDIQRLRVKASCIRVVGAHAHCLGL